MGETWVEVARADGLSDSVKLAFDQVEREQFAEGDRGVLVIEFVAPIFAGAVEQISNMLQWAGVELWGPVKAEGSRLYIYGRTGIAWVAPAIAVILSLSLLAIASVILYKVTTDVGGGTMILVLLGIIAFMVLKD